MMFVTVGTGPEGFDRLVRGVDAVADGFDESIRAQIGRGNYIPENIDWFRFTDEAEIHELYRTASVVIAHAGAGTLLMALSYETPVVILPRRKNQGEHNDDHQMELANALSNRSGVFVIDETDELKSAITQASSRTVAPPQRDKSLSQFLSRHIDNLDQ